ncbi:MAG: hypothetical protein H7141_07895 [Burkholderiales bacterium]|nr:hypothetical protein [Bacteroidia bacterium]
MKSTNPLSFNNSEKRVRIDIKTKFCLLSTLFLFQVGTLFSQKLVYDNFEGNKFIRYGERSGVLDTLAKNPKVDSVNKSSKCAFYTRNAARKFDNIKMSLNGKLTGVNEYATYLGIPPKLKIKVFTTAPAGTLVEILLGSKNGNNDYPAGTNSQFQCYTTKTNAWEYLEFKFSQVPQGSETSFEQIDQVTLLFNPNSSTSDSYYFDEITGPGLTMVKNEPIATPNEEAKKADTPAPKKSNTSKKETSNKKLSKN